MADDDWIMGSVAAQDGYKPEPMASPFDVSNQQSTGVGWANRFAEKMYAPREYDATPVAKTASPLVTINRGDIDRATDMALNFSGGGLTFAGKTAKTADLGALARAEKMAAEGHPPEAIRGSTGWLQFPDKQWRFEISDANAKIKPEMYPASQHGAPVPLGSVVHHPEVFAAYPELATRTDAIIARDIPSGAKGEFRPGSQQYGISPSITLLKTNPTDMRSTLLHEMTHNIQGIENFAKGASGDTLLDKGSIGWQLAKDKYKELSQPMSPEELQSTLKQAGKEGLYKSYDDYVKRHEIAMGTDAYRQKLLEASYRYGQMETYKRSAGEAEARAVQARRDYTPEQAAAEAPSETMAKKMYQPVPVEDQIVNFKYPGEY